MWAFKGSKKLMKMFGELIYNSYLSTFRKHTRMYPIHNGNAVDLEKFFQKCIKDEEAIALAKRLIMKYSVWLNEDGLDKMAVDILREVKYRLTYTPDMDQWSVGEYWQTPTETLKSGKGDCEDGAILIVTLLRLLGVPDNRIFLNAGWVSYRNRKVGHAYVTYLGDDGAEYILDWCFFNDLRRIPTRKRNWYDDRYIQPVWFKGNDQGFYKK